RRGGALHLHVPVAPHRRPRLTRARLDDHAQPLPQQPARHGLARELAELRRRGPGRPRPIPPPSGAPAKPALEAQLPSGGPSYLGPPFAVLPGVLWAGRGVLAPRARTSRAQAFRPFERLERWRSVALDLERSPDRVHHVRAPLLRRHAVEARVAHVLRVVAGEIS